MIGTDQVNVDDRLECTRCQLSDRHKKIASGASSGKGQSAHAPQAQRSAKELHQHHKVDPSKLCYTLLHRLLKACIVPDVNCSQPEHLCSSSRFGDFSCHPLRLCYIAANETCVGTQTDQRRHLSTADVSSASRAEYNFIIWNENVALAFPSFLRTNAAK